MLNFGCVAKNMLYFPMFYAAVRRGSWLVFFDSELSGSKFKKPHVGIQITQLHPQSLTAKAPKNGSRWWFQICFIFTPIWGRFPI